MVLSAIGTLFALRDVHCDTNNDDGTDGVNGDTPYDPAIKQAACATGNVE
jgi:DHA2 family multidrug resistance protein-like MFS transporter